MCDIPNQSISQYPTYGDQVLRYSIPIPYVERLIFFQYDSLADISKLFDIDIRDLSECAGPTRRLRVLWKFQGPVNGFLVLSVRPVRNIDTDSFYGCVGFFISVAVVKEWWTASNSHSKHISLDGLFSCLAPRHDQIGQHLKCRHWVRVETNESVFKLFLWQPKTRCRTENRLRTLKPGTKSNFWRAAHV